MVASSPFTVPQTLEPVASHNAKPKGEWSQRFGIPKETGSFDYTLPEHQTCLNMSWQR